MKALGLCGSYKELSSLAMKDKEKAENQGQSSETPKKVKFQPRQVFCAKVRALAGKEWDPDTWVSFAPENLESSDSTILWTYKSGPFIPIKS